jgi:hypothetical protein
MDDLPPKTERVWYVIYLIAVLGIVMFGALCFEAMAQEQQPICAPIGQLAPLWEQHHHERIAWEGVVPQPGGQPREVILFQSDKGAWSLFVVQDGIACMVAAGVDGTPMDSV